MDKYFSKMEIIIQKIFSRNENFTFNYDILKLKIFIIDGKRTLVKNNNFSEIFATISAFVIFFRI